MANQEIKASVENIRGSVTKLDAVREQTATKLITHTLTHGNSGKCQIAMSSVLKGASDFGNSTNWLARVTSQFMSKVADEYEEMDTALANTY